MKQAVKALVSTTIFLLFTHQSHTQLRVPQTTSIAPDIRRVIDDYPNHFANLQGQLIVENPQSADYECTFNVAGAEQTTVTRYSARKQNVYSWQALMLTTDDFEEAKKKFRSIFNQLNRLQIKIGTSRLELNGKYEQPVEEMKFTSVVLILDGAGETMKKMRVEVQMVYELLEWKVKVLVYDRERKDDEIGEQVD